MNIRRKPELLIPASSLEVLKVAVLFGADAVYIGGEVFGLRAKAKNFTMEEMAEGIRFAHEHGVKVYVTANILAHNDDLEGVEAYFQDLKKIGVVLKRAIDFITCQGKMMYPIRFEQDSILKNLMAQKERLPREVREVGYQQLSLFDDVNFREENFRNEETICM